MPRLTIVVTSALVLAVSLSSTANTTRQGGFGIVPIAEPNDNRQPAGRWEGDTLVLDLEVREGRWYPSDDSSAVVHAPFFAEVGKAPQVPGPLIRLPRGRALKVSLRNSLGDSTITVFGLQSLPSPTRDSVVLRPGEERVLRFVAREAGTYLYRGVAGAIDYAVREREQLAGAIVVDSADTAPNDRVFVINIWGEPRDSGFYANALAINGRSWPSGERVQATLGDTLRWRIVNASTRPHPMHLHGFYFRVQGKGDETVDTAYSAAQQRLAVTELMAPFSTMKIAWGAERPGNWLFHCHLSFHVVPEAGQLQKVATDDMAEHSAPMHMVGLVLGVQIHPTAGWIAPVRRDVRRLTLYVQEGARRARAPHSMGYILKRDSRAPAADSLESPSTLLVLRRGEPTDITVINRLNQPTGVHWHGIELESPSDGVVGWSGMGDVVAPQIDPGKSFTARLTLPRAGTFLYHTHLNDLTQLTAGLYGALVVLPNDISFDPSTDHVYLMGWDGPQEPAHHMVNGDSVLAPTRFRHGAVHRLRFGCIGVVDCPTVTLMKGDSVVDWRALAKDGADLDAAHATKRPANVSLWAGETYDVAFEPTTPGEYRLVFGDAKKPDLQQRIVVR